MAIDKVKGVVLPMDKCKEVVLPMDKGKGDVSPLEVVPHTIKEVPEMEPPSDKHWNYGHYHQEVGPTSFCKVILAQKLECLPMPLDFTKHFPIVPIEFRLKTNTGCVWRFTVRLMNDKITLDQAGWATFTVIHQIKIRYMVTFKLVTSDTLKVIIFNHDGIEVVTKCGKHDAAFVMNV